MKKQILSLALAVLLVLAIAPGVSAASYTVTKENFEITKVIREVSFDEGIDIYDYDTYNYIFVEDGATISIFAETDYGQGSYQEFRLEQSYYEGYYSSDSFTTDADIEVGGKYQAGETVEIKRPDGFPDELLGGYYSGPNFGMNFSNLYSLYSDGQWWDIFWVTTEMAEELLKGAEPKPVPMTPPTTNYTEVVAPKYDWVHNFSEGLALVAMDGEYGFIDETGNTVQPPAGDSRITRIALLESGDYDNVWDIGDMFVVGRGDWGTGRWGLLDKDGNEIVPPDTYGPGLPAGVSEGLMSVNLDGKWSVIDKTGTEVVSFEHLPPETRYVGPFSEGLAPYRIGDDYETQKMGFIDKTGNVIVQPTYKSVGDFSEGLAPFRIGDDYETEKTGFIDKTGNVIVQPIYKSVGDFSEGLAAVCDDNYAWGFIDKTGNVVVPLQYRSVGNFSEGLALVDDDGEQAFIDKTDRVVLSLKRPGASFITNGTRYDEMFIEGLAVVQSSTRNGSKYGVYDKTGAELVPPIYDRILPLSEGMAAVCVYTDLITDDGISYTYVGKWGFIKIGGTTPTPTPPPSTPTTPSTPSTPPTPSNPSTPTTPSSPSTPSTSGGGTTSTGGSSGGSTTTTTPPVETVTALPAATVTASAPTQAQTAAAETAVAAVADKAAATSGASILAVAPPVTVSTGTSVPTVTKITLPEGVPANEITTLAVVNEDGTLTPVPARINEDGTVTTLVSGDVTLVPLHVEPSFVDTDLGTAYVAVTEEINQAAAMMIVEGRGNGVFDPAAQVTTQESVTMFLRAIGVPVDYSTAMTTGAAHGLNTAAAIPTAPMTRIDTATLLVNALEDVGMKPSMTAAEANTVLAGFYDVSVLTEQERIDLAICVKLGIFKGYGGSRAGEIGPNELLQRSHMASLSVRLQDVILGR